MQYGVNNHNVTLGHLDKNDIWEYIYNLETISYNKMRIKFMGLTVIFVVLISIFLVHGYTSTEFKENENVQFKNILDSDVLIKDAGHQIWTVIIASGNPFRDLHGVKSLSSLLMSKGYPSENICSLIQEEATKDAILIKPFDWLLTKNVTDEDIIIFYFSLHGDRIEDQHPLDEPDGYDEYLVPYDYNPENKTSYIFDEELNKKFDGLNGKNLVLIFETCYSGGMLDGYEDLVDTGRIILTSCDNDESSWPMYLQMRWLFPNFLFRGLKAPADQNHDGWVSAEESFLYAKDRTISRSTVYAQIFSLVPFVPHDFNPQYPQLYDGWPSDTNNTEELKLFNVQEK